MRCIINEIIQKIEKIDKHIDSCYLRNDILDFNVLMDIGVELGNHIRSLILICTGLISEEELEKDAVGYDLYNSVIVGHLVRIYKTYDQLVYFVAENKGEISSIFIRLIFESYAKMKYLILNGEESIKSFIECSFRSSIKQYKFIKKREKLRSLISIERRIIERIENRIELAGLSIDELLKKKNWDIDRRNFYSILEYLQKNDQSGMNWSLGYSFIFGSGSSLIHGTWYDILTNHLELKNDKFFPKYSYDSVDPKYILPPSTIPVHACLDFIEWRGVDSEDYIKNILLKMKELLLFLNIKDEERIKMSTNSLGDK